MTGQLQGFTDGLDAAVHHVRWCDHLGTGFGMGQRLAYQGIDGDVVLDVAFFIENAVLAVGGEWVQGNVGDHPQFRETLTQGTSGTLGNTVGIPGFGAVEGFLFHRGYREQREGRNAQFYPLLRSFQQQVDGQTLDARHRGDFFAAVFAIEDKHREDQVIDSQNIFANQTTGKVVTTVATQTGGRKQTVSGGKAHGRLLSPRRRASATVISGHYDA
ncbi:hypothetical protein D3C78_928960 [compost metagenome]